MSLQRTPPDENLTPLPASSDNALLHEYDTGLKAFIYSFGGWWLTAMSGPLSVPVAIIGILWTTGVLRVAFCALAFVAWIGSAWWVWRQEREAKRAKQGLLQAERDRNARARFTGAIHQVSVFHNPMSTRDKPSCVVELTVHFGNEGAASTVRHFQLVITAGDSSYSSEKVLHGKLHLRNSVLVDDTAARNLGECLNSFEPIERGHHREGWLQFIVGVADEKVEGCRAALLITDGFGDSHRIT